jgi:hypothetical protein
VAAFRWQAQALCRDEPAQLVDPAEGEGDRATLRLVVNVLCGRCPVQAACRAAGQHPSRHMPPDRPVRKVKRRPRPPVGPDWSTPDLRALHTTYTRCRVNGWPVPTQVREGEREYQRRRAAWRRASRVAS